MPENIIYDRVGVGYNKSRCADPNITDRLFSLLNLSPGSQILDIGCGTGNYTVALQKLGLRMTGIDPSETMLREARGKSNEVDWILGSAEIIALDRESVNGVLATFTTHHWKDPKRAFMEIRRVLKPGGRVVLLTFTPEQEAGYWLNHYFPKMMEKTIKREVNYQVVIAAAEAAGLKVIETEKYLVQPGLQDLFLYAGKDRPEMYFDPEVRQGISSFSISAVEEELRTGLTQLRQDIDSGAFEDVKKGYENELGDYLFVVLG